MNLENNQKHLQLQRRSIRGLQGLNFAISIIDVLEELQVKRPVATKPLNACGNYKI